MRRSFAVVALVVLVVGSMGLMRWSGKPPFGATEKDQPGTSPPERQPVTPESPSTPGASTPAAPGGRLEAQRLLRARDFDGLTRLLEAKQQRLQQDIRREEELARGLAAFQVADPALTPLLEAWVASEPAGWASRLARAEHRVAVAWERRGTKWASETSDEQFAGMQALLGGAVEDARQALERNPKLTEAYGTLLVAARGYSDHGACAKLADMGLAVAPASMRIRAAFAHCLLPRWGGSYEAVAAFARESQRYTSRNPALAALVGFVEWDRGRLAAQGQRYEEATALLTRAIDAGEYSQFYSDRADAYLWQKRYTEALADVARALALAPEEPDTLVLRAKILAALARHAEALGDVQVVAELDPTNEKLAHFRQREAETAVAQGYQLLEMTKDIDGSIDRYTWAIQIGGDNAEALYWRGRAYLRKDDRAHAFTDFEEAVRVDPRHFESYRNLDWLLAQRGDWDGIIRRWNRYLELEPMSGQAYLERGGAYHHKGDLQAALSDARKACELGAEKACGIIGHGTAMR